MNQNVSFMTPEAVQAGEIERRKKLAESLQAQSLQQAPTETVNGWAVKQSPLNAVAKLAQAYFGTQGIQKANEESLTLANQQQERRGADMSMLVNALGGRQAKPAGISEDASGNVTPTDPIAAQNPAQSLQQAMTMIKDPQVQQMAMGLTMEQMKPQALFDKPNVKDYTPASVAKYSASRNPADLVPVREAHFADAGGRVVPLDKITGQPVGEGIAKGLTPDASANLAFRQFEYGNLSANQRAQLQTELTRIGISQQQLAEGRAQIVQDAEGNIHVVNKLTGAAKSATGEDGKPLQGQQKPTESQMKAAVYHSQMASATDALSKIQGYDPNSGMTQADTAVAGGRGNMIASEAAQRAKQAQSQWAEAFLRYKTGAASTPAEVALNVATFFPQIGDKPGVIAQKASQRAQAERDMAMASGRKIPQAVPTDTANSNMVSWADLGR